GREEGLQKGLQAGRQEGLQAGRLEERRESTRDLLTRRFGPLPEQAQQRIESASMAEMKHWTNRLFEARTLDDIFR
ncbi:transposase, partial [Vibrio agarivorans]